MLSWKSYFELHTGSSKINPSVMAHLSRQYFGLIRWIKLIKDTGTS